MIRTRFAPSPTGFLHIGGVRTALYCWLFAKSKGGQFLLRIEDTDLERSTQESVETILEGMKWLGLDFEEEVVFQSKRFEIYQQKAEELIQSGHAYKCYCTSSELEEMRSEQIKLGRTQGMMVVVEIKQSRLENQLFDSSQLQQRTLLSMIWSMDKSPFIKKSLMTLLS